MINVPETYGRLVFDERVMKTRLSDSTYTALQETILQGKTLDAAAADAVAAAMRDWAVENGATHYTHWFQPLNGFTAEKHDSFISPSPDGGVIMDFSGKELIQGEPDASSFPSGGLRATFEARGYTAWDPTSYAFIKGKTLCIPTAFCSYGGDALDKKTPLLRSMEAINREALRILKLFGNTEVGRVTPCVGAEQEYFLIDRKAYNAREDLIFTGRTLFGAKPPKGQEMEDHYFGMIKPRVQAFMDELNEELWQLGVPAKTEHNETAPAQHELASVYSTANIATDHNQLIMEVMKKVAERHGMACLLAEKSFAGVNGSGKHNNWSLSTDTGVNLFSPGETPHENAQFLLFLVAVIEAVDRYQGLLRVSVASAGNDHRLGGSEAPPAVISIFLGDELTGILEAIEKDEPYSSSEKTVMKLGVHALPRFMRDTTDRNRTSPFAFTGNKFEFRMPGAPMSIAGANTILNAATADVLREYADRLEGADDLGAALHDLIREAFTAHKRIIFNGNGYDDAWLEEAKKRGLLDLRTAPDAIPQLIEAENAAMLTREKVYTAGELKAHYEIKLDSYNKFVGIEAVTMSDMVKRQILPAVSAYTAKIAGAALTKRTLLPQHADSYEMRAAELLSELTEAIDERNAALEKAMAKLHTVSDPLKKAETIRDSILPKMAALRASCDEAETLTAKEQWPIPTYAELLYSV